MSLGLTVDSCIPRCMITRDNVSGDTCYLSNFWPEPECRRGWQQRSWNEIKYVVWSPASHRVTPYISIFSWRQTLRQAANEKERNFVCYHFSCCCLSFLDLFLPKRDSNFSFFSSGAPHALTTWPCLTRSSRAGAGDQEQETRGRGWAGHQVRQHSQ